MSFSHWGIFPGFLCEDTGYWLPTWTDDELWSSP
jgi:hypothetical protein